MTPGIRLVAGTAVVGLLLTYPLVANDFWVLHIAGRTFSIGTVALSLVFLLSYAGMLSLAQMTVAGIAGYVVATCTTLTSGNELGLFWPAAVLLAVGCAVVVSLAIGFVAVRTEGIYTLMITLAIAMGFYYLTLQNYIVFNGFTGFTQVPTPTLLGVSLGSPLAFYYLCLSIAALCIVSVLYIAGTPFGLALQAMRDNPRRLRALGYPVGILRVLAFGVAGFIAGLGGILNVWLNGSISPGSVGIVSTTDVLIAAVLGGLRWPVGAYAGAFVLTVMQSFAIAFVNPERFNTVIGLVFIGAVVFSPDGLVGIWNLAARIPHRTIPQTGNGSAQTMLQASQLQQEGGSHHAQ
jgi:branched-chain amino acid transport system permease protein